MTEKSILAPQSDAEAQLGVCASSWTAPRWSAALALGTVLTAVFYGILTLLRLRWPGVTAMEMFFHGGWLHRSVIPYVTMFLSFVVLAGLLLKARKIAVQLAALRALPAWGANAEAELAGRFPHPEDFLGASLFRMRLAWERAALPHHEQMQRLEAAFADLERISETTYTPLRGMLWAIPVLGFIGTVLGLSLAVRCFGVLMRPDSLQASFESALAAVTGGLATAFETTLIALSAALVLQLSSTFILHREELLLERAKAIAGMDL